MQTWDAAGNLETDTGTYLGRIINELTIVCGTDGSETNANLLLGTPFWQVTFLSNYSSFLPTITVVGDTIYWAWNGKTSGLSYKLVYGVW